MIGSFIHSESSVNSISKFSVNICITASSIIFIWFLNVSLLATTLLHAREYQYHLNCQFNPCFNADFALSASAKEHIASMSIPGGLSLFSELEYGEKLRRISRDGTGKINLRVWRKVTYVLNPPRQLEICLCTRS